MDGRSKQDKKVSGIYYMESILYNRIGHGKDNIYKKELPGIII